MPFTVLIIGLGLSAVHFTKCRSRCLAALKNNANYPSDAETLNIYDVIHEQDHQDPLYRGPDGIALSSAH